MIGPTYFLPAGEARREMLKTRLSSKGQVIIPKAFRDAYNWRPGQEFIVIATGDGLMLKVGGRSRKPD